MTSKAAVLVSLSVASLKAKLGFGPLTEVSLPSIISSGRYLRFMYLSPVKGERDGWAPDKRKMQS